MVLVANGAYEVTFGMSLYFGECTHCTYLWVNIATEGALSEEIAQPTVYHHVSQVSVDIHLDGLIKLGINDYSIST